MDSIKLSTRQLILLFFVSSFSIKIIHCGVGLLFGSSRVEAFGRDVELGNFYDSRNDKLGPKEITFLEGPIPSWAITTEKTPTRSSHTAVIKKPIDIFKNFEVDKEVKINYLLGIMDIAPRGKYLKLSKEIIGTAVVMGDVVFKYGTVSQTLNIFDSELDPAKQSSIVVKNKTPWGFTHIVTGIQYGAIVSVCFKYNGDDGELPGASSSTHDVENHLKRQMEFLRDTNRTAIFKKYFKENPSAPRFHFEITGDIPITDDIPIIDVFDVINFLDKVPDEIKQLNGGKGQPVSFDVQPIDSVKAVLSMNSIGSSSNASDFDFESELFQIDDHTPSLSKTTTTTEEPETKSPFHFSIPSPPPKPTGKIPTLPPKITPKITTVPTTTIRTTTRKTTTTTEEPQTESPFHFSIPSKTTPRPKSMHFTTTKKTTTTPLTTTTTTTSTTTPPPTTTTTSTTTTTTTTTSTTPLTTTTPETTTLETTTFEPSTTPETTTESISTTTSSTSTEIIPISEIQQSEARLLAYSNDCSRFRIDFRFLLLNALLCQLLLVI